MDLTTESATSGTKTYKEGTLIKGKDFIRLESPLILPPKNSLETEAQDLVGAINELFFSGTGTANDDFRAVIDDGAGNILIVVQKDDIYADYAYTYEYVDFSDDLTTQSTDPEGNVTTTTRSFKKRIITKVTDSEENVILNADYDAESGVVHSYNDTKGEPIRLEEWRTAYDISEAQSEGAKSAVIAWVLAKNMEQSESVSQQKNAYRKGVADYADEDTVVTEEWETTDREFTISPDGSSPALTDLSNGFTSYYEEKKSGEITKVRIYINSSYEEIFASSGKLSAIRKGELRIEEIQSNGTTYNTYVADRRLEQYNYYMYSSWDLKNIKINCKDDEIQLIYGRLDTFYDSNGNIESTANREITYNYPMPNCKYVYTSNF